MKPMNYATRRALGVAVTAWLVAQVGGGSALGGSSLGGSGTVTGGGTLGHGGSLVGGAPGGGTAGADIRGASTFGGTSTYGGATLGPRPIDQLERAVRQPPPSLPPAMAPRQDSVWVPDRYLDRPGGTFHVPGHWEQRLTPQQHYVPPLTVCNSGSGACAQVPAGVRPPPEVRSGP
jgi:hypothetical protein